MRATCQCESVEIEVTSVAPLGINCYCSICRKISGGAYAPTLMVDRNALRVVRGEALLSKYNATPTLDRYHCSKCHSPVYGISSTNDDLPVFVPAGIFDGKDIAHVVFDHMFVSSMVPWHRIADSRTQHQTYPG